MCEPTTLSQHRIGLLGTVYSAKAPRERIPVHFYTRYAAKAGLFAPLLLQNQQTLLTKGKVNAWPMNQRNQKVVMCRRKGCDVSDFLGRPNSGHIISTHCVLYSSGSFDIQRVCPQTVLEFANTKPNCRFQSVIMMLCYSFVWGLMLEYA